MATATVLDPESGAVLSQRITKRAYTHAIAIRRPEIPRLCVWSFHQSAPLAEKERASLLRKQADGRGDYARYANWQFLILPVT